MSLTRVGGRDPSHQNGVVTLAHELFHVFWVLNAQPGVHPWRTSPSDEINAEGYGFDILNAKLLAGGDVYALLEQLLGISLHPGSGLMAGGIPDDARQGPPQIYALVLPIRGPTTVVVVDVATVTTDLLSFWGFSHKDVKERSK